MRKPIYFWIIGLATAHGPSLVIAEEPQPVRVEIVTPKTQEIAATGINGKGEVIGFEWQENKTTPGVIEQVPFFAKGQEMTPLPLLEGYTATFPAAISDNGEVVGRASKPAPRGVFVPMRNQAFIWDAAKGIRGLGVPEGDAASFASDITPDGQRISGFAVGENRVRACVWDRDGDGWKITVLPHVSNLGSNTVAISDNGQYAAAVDGEKPSLWTLESSGTWKQELIGDPASLIPRGVNNSALVVGLRNTTDGHFHAMTWTRETGVKQLAKLLGHVRSQALAVNNAGVIVGMTDGPPGTDVGPSAFFAENGKTHLIETQGYYFSSATAINDKNQVTGDFDEKEEPVAPSQPVSVPERPRPALPGNQR